MEALLIILIAILLVTLFIIFCIYKSTEKIREDLRRHFDSVIPAKHTPKNTRVFRVREGEGFETGDLVGIDSQGQAYKVKVKDDFPFLPKLSTKYEPPRAIVSKPRTKGKAKAEREEKNTPALAKLSMKELSEVFGYDT